MAKVIWDVSMSLDGFTTGPNVGADVPMGEGGEALHAWMEGTGPDGKVDREVLGIVNADLGAAIVGRHTFDLGLKLWGGTPWAGLPTLVITHRPRDDLRGGNGGTFAFGDLEASVRRAREAAGDKNVTILGADVARQLLRGGHVDAIRLHIVPIVLGAGTPMFTGEQATLIRDRPPLVGSVTHHFFSVAKS